jgi:hypothetical protein
MHTKSVKGATLKDGIEVRQLISDANSGDTEAFSEIKTAVGILKALRHLRETKTLRQALMTLGYNYFGASLREVGKIFKVDEKMVRLETRAPA